ncbi:MAG: STAS/SEC14 domain-containing protein [Myxococcales bacterium]|nr:STAS/SEC14 domain-containing protein [Myxococcales bacterium]
MPFEFSDRTTASGMSYLHIDVSAKVLVRDCELLGERLRSSGPHLPRVISIIAKGTEYTTEARRSMLSLEHEYGAMAIVVTSMIVRAAINLMLRTQSGSSGPVRFFTDEAVALAWLEQQTVRARE